MFGGFDPAERPTEFFERRRGPAIAIAIALYLAMVGVVWLSSVMTPEASEVEEEEVIDVLLAEKEEEERPEEEEVEVEDVEEPEPPPPDAPPPPPSAKPTPPDAPPPVEDTTPVEVKDQDIGKDKPTGEQGTGYGTGGGGKTGNGEGDDAPVKDDNPPAEDEGKKPPKVVASDVLTPDDSPATPDPSNPVPEYPSAMQKRGIEGKVTVKYTVHASGKMTKVAFTTVTNTATKPDEIDKANEVMKKSVQKAMSQWKFLEPCKRNKKTPFTCTMKKTFPFKLT